MNVKEICKEVRRLCKDERLQFFFAVPEMSEWSVTNCKHLQKLVDYHKELETSKQEPYEKRMWNKILSLPTANAIPIPEGATNGDMIKAMFPDLEFTKGDYGISACFMKMNNDVGFASLYETWWNAPYKGGCNLSEKPTGSESEDKE